MSVRLVSLLLLISCIVPFFPQTVFSGDLTSSYIRLSRIAPSLTTGGLVCTTTPVSDNGVENQVQVIFPSGFTVNSTSSNWTVSTSDIPAGTNPWPGISTASSVNGQTVTFPSSNLAANTTYCFEFASSSTLTNPSSPGSYSGTLRTRNSSNVTIDSVEVGFAISNDQIIVTATVPASPTDFEATLIKYDPPRNTFGQNESIQYRLTYANLLSHPATITVEAEWELGTIQGQPVASEDVLDYVIGTATNGYATTPPVIDTLNRKISWTINSFPANSSHTVAFTLRTNNSFTDDVPVSFSVNGRVLGPGTQTPDSTVTSTYLNTTFITATPAPPCSINCPTSIPGPTLTPSPVPPAFRFSDIEVRSISATSAAIFVSTNRNSSVRINYGNNLQSLPNFVTSDVLSTSHLLSLTNLRPKTRYFFRVIATDNAGNEVFSDIYLLDTAGVTTNPPVFLPESLIITSDDIVLSDPLNTLSVIPNIVLPISSSFSFKFALMRYEEIRQVRGFVRNENVLGINSTTSSNSESLNITEIAPGRYLGRLGAGPTPGSYSLVLQIRDYIGNVVEQRVSDFTLVKPLTIIDKTTGKGIEGAKVTFYFYNFRLKTYEILSSSITPITNPVFSNPDGTAPGILPEGKYRIKVESLGHKSQTAEFEIGPKSSNYPTIELQALPFNIQTFVAYTAAAFGDMLSLLENYLHTLRGSVRFFDSIAFFVVFISVALGVLSTSKKLSIPLHLLPGYLLFSLIRIVTRNKKTHDIHGRIINGEGEGVAGAQIYVSFAGKVLGQTHTNSQGEFFTTIKTDKAVKISAGKKGFNNDSITIPVNKLGDKIAFVLAQNIRPKSFSFSTVSWYAGYISGSIFEAILIVSLVIELLFVLEFGWLKVAPFLIISLFNVVLFAVHARQLRAAGS